MKAVGEKGRTTAERELRIGCHSVSLVQNHEFHALGEQLHCAGEVLDLVPHHADATIIRSVQLGDTTPRESHQHRDYPKRQYLKCHALPLLAVQPLGASDDGGSLPGSRGSVQQQVWQLICVNEAVDCEAHPR